jgi:hypothetical protein
MDRRGLMAVCRSVLLVLISIPLIFPRRHVFSSHAPVLTQATQVGDVILGVDSESVIGMVRSLLPEFS